MLDRCVFHATLFRVFSLLRRFSTVSFVLLAPMLLASWRFRGFLADDDVIVRHLADRLASGKGLTLNDGEYVHAITSGLAVLVAFVAEVLGIDSLLLVRLHAALGSLAAGWAVVWVADHQGVGRRVSVPFAAAVLVTLPFSLWSLGAVGGTTMAAIVAWIVAIISTSQGPLSSRDLRRLTLLVSLLFLIRVDAPVLALPVLVLVLLRGEPVRTLQRLVLPVVLFWLLLLAAQYGYYGSVLPDVGATKFSLSPRLIRVGALYLFEFLQAFSPLVLAVAFLVFRARRSLRLPLTGPVVFPLLLASIWVSYLLWIGGDWMPGYRHFALVITLLALAAIQAAPSTRTLLMVLPVIMCSSLLSLTFEPADRASDSIRWLAHCQEGSAMLKATLSSKEPLMAVEPAGCPPYVTGFASVDMLGLFDEHIAHSLLTGSPVSWTEWQNTRNADPSASASDRYIPGHGKGDGAYVWDREPDLFVLCDPGNRTGEGCFKSWLEIRSSFDLLGRYRLLPFDIGAEETWKVWVRWDGGRTGVVYRDGSVEVPAWLLGEPGASAMSGSAKGTKLEILPGQRVSVPPLELPVGAWSWSEIPASIRVTSLDRCATVDGNLLQATTGCRVRLSVENTDDVPVSVDSFELTVTP